MDNRPAIIIGQRRYEHTSWAVRDWVWKNIQDFPSVDVKRTPFVVERLKLAGLIDYSYAVDLLPPGGDWDEEQAQNNARYLAGVFDALEPDAVLFLSGKKVAEAFAPMCPVLTSVPPLVLAEGRYVLLHSLHGRKPESTWQDEGYRETIQRSIVAARIECESTADYEALCEACDDLIEKRDQHYVDEPWHVGRLSHAEQNELHAWEQAIRRWEKRS